MLSIRPKIYLGTQGWILYGSPKSQPNWNVRVFDTDRAVLEAIRTSYEVGESDPTRHLLEPHRSKV